MCSMTLMFNAQVRRLYKDCAGLVSLMVQMPKDVPSEDLKSFAYGNYDTKAQAEAAQAYISARLPKRPGLACSPQIRQKLWKPN